MKDKILGELEFNKYVWRRSLNKTLFGSEIDVRLLVQDNNQEGILEVQRNAYKTYLKNEERFINEIPSFLLDYYKWHFEEIARKVELEESDQRNVATENTIFEMCNVCQVFICRDGSYAWVFACSWNDDGFAVLLSESHPRVITRDQLRHLHKLNDSTLGLMVHDGGNTWIGLEQNDFFGQDEDLRIEVEGSAVEDISTEQQKAYDEYLEKKEDYFNELTQMMLGVYMGSDMKAEDMMHSGQKITVQTILPKTLYIDKEGNYGWICYTQWDDSYIGVLLSDDKLYFLSEENLRNYRNEKKVKDDVLGLLFPCYVGFENIVVVRLIDEVRTMQLTVGSDDNVLEENHRTAFNVYKAMRPTFWDEIKDVALKYYLDRYDDLKEYLNIPKSLKKENVNRDSVLNILTFTKLYINESGRIAWLCESPTAPDDGLGFDFTKGKIKCIYQYEVI